MYSIQININKRKIEMTGETGQHVGVLRKDGELSYRPFAGFVEKYLYPIKLSVTGYKVDDTWTRLPEDSLILGAWNDGEVFAVVPFRVFQNDPSKRR